MREPREPFGGLAPIYIKREPKWLLFESHNSSIRQDDGAILFSMHGIVAKGADLAPSGSNLAHVGEPFGHIHM